MFHEALFVEEPDKFETYYSAQFSQLQKRNLAASLVLVPPFIVCSIVWRKRHLGFGRESNCKGGGGCTDKSKIITPKSDFRDDGLAKSKLYQKTLDWVYKIK